MQKINLEIQIDNVASVLGTVLFSTGLDDNFMYNAIGQIVLFDSVDSLARSYLKLL